jgi:hypothetical protein
MSPYKVWLVCSMLAVITKFHVSLVVDDPLNVWSIDHILGPMVEHIHQLCPKNMLMEKLDHQVCI